jgi:hypothetical protein
MYTGEAHATRETPTRDQEDQPDTREGQTGRAGVAERLVVPLKPGNARGRKGPQFRAPRRGRGFGLPAPALLSVGAGQHRLASRPARERYRGVYHEPLYPHSQQKRAGNCCTCEWR